MRNKTGIEDVRNAEREWHDAFYQAHAECSYPNSAEDFHEIFVKGRITPFCEGGWSWWGDTAGELLEAVGDVRGMRVLDYGCGYGFLGMYLSLCGAHSWGFDFSRAAIETAKKAALRYGLEAQFAQMDASDLSYPDEFFDLVVGFGVLHHVIKYPGTASQLLRVMEPGAKAMFQETLGHNPFINFARRFTMVDDDAGDTLLREDDILTFGREFSSVGIEQRHLIYMLKRLAKRPAAEWYAELKPRPLWCAVKKLDNVVLRFSPLRRFCGEAIVTLTK
jgi:2-polyprenyl-3-methyl-5-hydroxy-6-metoxy-1,4-benzoquinol methylase